MKKMMPHHNNKEPLSIQMLSATELQILRLTKKGLTALQIAKVRGCSSRTIEKHRSNIIKKLKLPSSPHALLLWTYNNLG